MSSREKMLGGLVAAAGLLYVANAGLAKYRRAVDAADQAQIEAEESLVTTETSLAAAEKERRELHDWRQRSLPTNSDIARSLYQDWLRKLASDTGLEKPQVLDKTNSRTFGRGYNEVTFDLSGQASLEQLTTLLYKFYQSGHLQRISKAAFTTTEASKKLSVTMTIDALILPGCKRTDALADEVEVEMPESLEDYRQRLVARDLFVAYTPKTSDQNNNESKADKATITAFYYGLGGWRSEVNVEDSDQAITLREGDPLEIGSLKGKVIAVDGRRIVYSTDEGQFEVRLGDHFGQAVRIDASDTQPAVSL